jgi:hypothetical protein
VVHNLAWEGLIRSRLIRRSESQTVGRRLIDLDSLQRFIEGCPTKVPEEIMRTYFRPRLERARQVNAEKYRAASLTLAEKEARRARAVKAAKARWAQHRAKEARK